MDVHTYIHTITDFGTQGHYLVLNVCLIFNNLIRHWHFAVLASTSVGALEIYSCSIGYWLTDWLLSDWLTDYLIGRLIDLSIDLIDLYIEWIKRLSEFSSDAVHMFSKKFTFDVISTGLPPSGVSYLNSHVSHYCPLVSLQSLLGNLAYLVLSLAKELLASSLQHLLVLPLNFHLKTHGNSR